MLEKYVIVLCAAALVSAISLPEPELRIINGNYVPIEDVPWQVALLRDRAHYCGGSIYNQRVILTAAHCVANVQQKTLLVRAGSTFKNFGGQAVEVSHIIRHKDYIFNDTKVENDVAVLILASPLELGPRVQPIELAEKSPPPGTNVLVTGWGALHDYPFLVSNEFLLGTNLTIVDHNDCVKAYISINVSIPANAVCAHGIGEGAGQGACRGDSGGPLVTLPDRRLIGIVSGVYKCARLFPEFYADVAVLRKWIVKTVETYFANA